jgi:hypothetical protein
MFLSFSALHDKHNIHTLSENITFTLTKDSLFYLFLKPVQIIFIISGNVLIFSIYTRVISYCPKTFYYNNTLHTPLSM